MKKITDKEIKDIANKFIICEFVQKLIFEEFANEVSLYELSSITLNIHNLYSEMLKTTKNKMNINIFLEKYEAIIKEMLLNSLNEDEIIYN